MFHMSPESQLEVEWAELSRCDLRLLATVSWRWGGGRAVSVSTVVLQRHQALQVLDVPDGGSQCLHLTQPLVSGAAAWQVVPQLGVALVHTAHTLPLALVPLLDEGGFEGTLEDTEGPMVVGVVRVGMEGGQVGQQPRTPGPQRSLVHWLNSRGWRVEQKGRR